MGGEEVGDGYRGAVGKTDRFRGIVGSDDEGENELRGEHEGAQGGVGESEMGRRGEGLALNRWPEVLDGHAHRGVSIPGGVRLECVKAGEGTDIRHKPSLVLVRANRVVPIGDF